ncbi:MAG TPA: L-2-amino-thiazoline-4-carboxylic acid hydrolase [Cyclobacteriaceae bacterium]|nr:L-2-amino-thiazoline-4-carboxylic acid hydrolase [Cyclobacteriaceae bacterium]
MKSFRKYFTSSVKNHFPEISDDIINEIEGHYKDIAVDINFAARSRNPIDRRLDFCAYFLALIKTLDGRGESYEMIRRICLEVVTEYVRPKNKIRTLLKRLPARLINTWLATILLKAFNKRVSNNENANGFVAAIITDKNETYGFGYGVDILECGICKLFNKHNYQKFSSILCEVDEVTSALAGLKLIRTGTIALGAKKCDFRFKKETTK